MGSPPGTFCCERSYQEIHTRGGGTKHVVKTSAFRNLLLRTTNTRKVIACFCWRSILQEYFAIKQMHEETNNFNFNIRKEINWNLFWKCSVCWSFLRGSYPWEFTPIGDFRVAFRLCFKASPSAKPFIWKIRFIRTQILVHLHVN